MRQPLPLLAGSVLAVLVSCSPSTPAGPAGQPGASSDVTATGSGQNPLATTPLVGSPAPRTLVEDATGRATTDRPDDAGGLQVHLIYALPADAADEHLDTNGAIAHSVNAANSWFAGQAGGTKLRIDAYKGAPDVTFFRSNKTQAQLGANNDARVRALTTELQAANAVDPSKIYAMYYGGGKPAPGEATVELGLGGSGFASVFIKQDPQATLATSDATAGSYEYAFVHETLHAMGFVPACAPHVTSTAHTDDDPTDIMSATVFAGVPKLDPQHHYFHAGNASCLDLARSGFLDPLPADLQLPGDRPLTTDLGQQPTRFTPALTPANDPGIASAEDRIFTALNAARTAAGKPTFTRDAVLDLAARKANDAKDATSWNAILAQAGFAASAGYSTANDPGGTDALVTAFAGSASLQKVVASADTTGVGVGMVMQGGTAQLGVAITAAKLQVETAALAQGPGNTYTLAVQVRARAGQPDQRVRLLVDDVAYVAPYNVTAGASTLVFASVPRSGKHHVTLGPVEASDASKVLTEQRFTVDGDQPAAQALTAGS